MTDSGQNEKSANADSAKDNAANGASAKPVKKEQKPRKGGRAAAVFAFFALLIALAAGAGAAAVWYFGEMEVAGLSERMSTVERGLESNVQDLVLPRVQKVESAQEQIDRVQSEQSDTLETLASESRTTRVQVSELIDKVEGGRRRYQLQEIEGLLLAANQRLRLHKDVGGAQRALELASQRIAELNDPRLFEIREQIVDEIAAVNALPQPDIEGLALTLTSLINKVPKLPLLANSANNYEGEVEKTRELDLPEKPWTHLLVSLRQALDSMFTIRRAGESYEPMLPPGQAFFLHQNLQLKLEAARLALLQKNTQLFSQTLDEAQQWLGEYYENSDAAVVSAMEQIGQIKKTELSWATPDISDGLEAMRDYLASQSIVAEPQDSAQSDSPETSDSEESAGPEVATESQDQDDANGSENQTPPTPAEDEQAPTQPEPEPEQPEPASESTTTPGDQ